MRTPGSPWFGLEPPDRAGRDRRSPHPPRDLSAGQQLALALAIQLSAATDLILLDEPTRGLDYPGKAVFGQWLQDLADAGSSVLVATHDVELVAVIADRVIVLADGGW